jgi:pSer/pThr/pTyr-binding forkhead associated (FHA) protein
MLVAAAALLLGAAIAALMLVHTAPAPAGPALAGAIEVEGSFTVAAPALAGQSLAGQIPQPIAVEAPGGDAASLEVIAGPARGTSIALASEPLVFGRSSTGPRSLGADSELSRQHARVWQSDRQTLVEDLGSTNGTFVNGRRVTAATPIASGDVIGLGASQLRLVEPEVAPVRPSPPTPRVLMVVGGPAKGTRLDVSERPLVLGRAERGGAKLAGDPELSRRHASVSLLDGRGLLVEDLGSRNGTFVKDHRIVAPTLIQPGDTIRIGTSELRFEAARTVAPGR